MAIKKAARGRLGFLKGNLVFTALTARSANLAADLAARVERRSVHIHIRDAGADGGEDFFQLASRDLLAGRGSVDDVRFGDLSGHGARLRALRREPAHVERGLGGRRLAQPDDDAAIDATLPEMDM